MLPGALHLHPFHCTFHGHVPKQQLLPGSSQAPAALLGPFSTCLSTHLGPRPQGDTPLKPGLLSGLLAVRSLGTCRAHPGSTPGSAQAGPESGHHVCKRWASRALFWGRPSWLQAWVCSW